MFMERLKLPVKFSSFLSLILIPCKAEVAVALNNFASLPRAAMAGDRCLEWLPEMGRKEPETLTPPTTFLMLRRWGGNWPL